MQTVGIRQLKNRLSEYMRLVRAGEEILITSHGDAATPPGLGELARRGTARGLVRHDPLRYRSYPRALAETTSRELLDLGAGRSVIGCAEPSAVLSWLLGEASGPVVRGVLERASSVR